MLSPLLLAHAGPATAQGPSATSVPAPSFTSTRIDPAIRNALGMRARTGRASPGYQRNERFEREGVIPVVIRFATPNAAARYAVTPLASGAFAASVNEAELATLEADPAVTRVSCDLAPVMLRMLDASANETGVAVARRALRKKDGTELDGRGVKIADIDSGVLVFQPALFRADGGVYRWVDVNGDGKLTPGVDGVDLDNSGTIEKNEKLQLLTADSPVRDGAFDAGVDYVYVDTNSNLERDYGRDFREDTPGLGEPIFIVDDVDRDGKAAISERLLRLGTSKVGAVLTASRNYRRGNSTTGIQAYGLSLLRDEATHRYADHGTSVAGILVGGIPERTKLLGLAPGAELITAVGGNWTTTVQWAIDEKADVILSEFGSYVGHPLDGSTEDDAMFDAAVAKGIAVVNPAGNLADGSKHRTLTLAAGSNAIPLKTEYGFDGAPLIAFSLLHRGDARAFSIKIGIADGTSVTIPSTSTSGPIEIEKNRLLTVTKRVSARGTHELHIEILAFSTTGSYGKMPAGRYGLTIDADASVEVDLYCKDSNTSWGYGLVFESNTPTRTLCHPATNDSGITLAAYTLHGDAGEIAGTMAKYSSSGPRIDGAVGVDLAAPANPWTITVPSDPAYRTIHYAQFGGTSGAGPHVAASLALLKQLHPTVSGAELQKKLLDFARRDSFVGDELRWGKGKLDLLAALELPRTDSAPPKVHLAFPSPAPLAQAVEIKPELDAPGTAPLRARWDLDDDGKPDTDWEPLAAKTLRSDTPASKDVKLEVLDAEGHLAGATARVVFAEPKAAEVPTTPAAGPAPAAEEGGGCGCSTTARDDRGYWIAAAFALVIARRRRATA
jgi:MYXO-CTERM domain-containing protein